MVKLLVAIIVFIMVILLFFSGSKVSKILAKKYKEEFTESASKNLTDLFLFIDPQILFRFNLVIIVVGGLLAWLITQSWFIAMVVAVVLFAMPKKIYEFLRQRRKKQFVAQLPDTLIMISSSMRAGSSLIGSLETMVSDAPAPTNQEFGLFLRELRIGGDFGETLDKMAVRIDDAEVDLVVAGMKISKEVGGNLADMLERLADTLRKKLEMEGKIDALTSQGKAQGIVMSLLPTLIVVALNHMEPEAMEHLWKDPAGWAVIAIALIMQYIGYRFIKKIITIDV